MTPLHLTMYSRSVVLQNNGCDWRDRLREHLRGNAGTKCSIRYDEIGLYSELKRFKQDSELSANEPYLHELITTARELVKDRRPPETNAYNEFLKDFVYVCDLDSTHWNLISSCGAAIWSTKGSAYHEKYRALARHRKLDHHVHLVKEAGRPLFDPTRTGRWYSHQNYDRYFDLSTTYIFTGW